MKIRCRQIESDDLDAVAALLCVGFADRDPAYWHRGFARHRDRGPPAGYPTYGFLIEAEGRIVGVLLTLHTRVRDAGHDSVRCNLSSWYVDPEFRAYGPMLDKMATRQDGVTYLNVTPAPHSWPMLEARHYRRYCFGQMLAVPALRRPRAGLSVQDARRPGALDALTPEDRALVRAHLDYGCVAYVCDDGRGARPLLFQRRTIGLVPNLKTFGQVPAMQLIYARDIDDAVLFAGPVGRRLLASHGTPLLVIDADGPIPGLAGRYFAGRAPKYQRGVVPVRLGDLAYTELVLFGP